MESQSKTTQTVFALKLLVLKTGEYDLWGIRMEQYLTFTDHALWEVIVNGDLVSPVASANTGVEGHIPPKTAKQKLERKNELKAKSTLMLAIPDEHLLKFHACKDAKSLWEAIKNRFGGNKESKKMQKTILKQNYENFAASSQEGLDKTYDRFQKLISQFEIYGEVISQEDANLKLLRSLPSAWNNIALIMRNKSDLDTLSMDDLYNNLKVYESEIKGKSSLSSNSQNVALVSSNYSSSTNETVNTALVFPTAKRGHFTRECREPRNQGNRNRDAPRRNALVDTSTTNALVVQDGIASSSSSSSDSEVNTCSKDCLKSYETLQKQYDQQRNALNKSNLEIIVLNNKGRVTGQREIRPVWNNAQRVNHQNKLTHPHPKRNFIPTVVATKSGQVTVNAAKQNSLRATISISTTRTVNTATPKPKVNDALPITYSYFKAHSPIIKTIDGGCVHLEEVPYGGEGGKITEKKIRLVLDFKSYSILDESKSA
ncbi:hypothetical protein Tco_0786571 [Tanacetum coccineum]